MSGQNKQPKAKNFRLALVDDATLHKIWEARFSRSGFLVRLISVIVVLFALVYVLLAYTPLRTSIPGYPTAQTRRDAIQNAIKVDSLESVISRWELYSDNLLRVLEGEEPIPVDSVLRLADAAEAAAADAQQLAGKDSLLRDYVRQEEQFGFSGGQQRDLPIEGVHFFAPVKGSVSEGFDRTLHPYIDVTAPANSVVMAALDGDVIFDGWNDESGYTIIIQHSGDMVTVYKHNEKLLKKAGDRVSAGASIALLGGVSTEERHLHFELWRRGEALDPALYINF